MSMFEMVEAGLLDGGASGGDWSDAREGIPAWGEVA